AIAGGERDVLAQHTDESFRADHMRFRNAGGAVVQVLMRSDFFATEAFFCDHGRHPFLEQRRGPGFCIMCSTVGWRRRIRSYASGGMPMTSSATVGPRARQLRCLCNWDSLSSADFITNIAESSFRHTHPIDSPFVSGALRTHNERLTEVLCPRGYSSRDDRCGIVRVAA